MTTSIINKIYIINDQDTTKLRKFKIKIQNYFKNIPIKIWINNKKDNINVSFICKQTCSNNVISEWNTHYNLWKHIIKKNDDRVLVLSSDIILDMNFSDKFDLYWNQIPHDWDIVYLGCQGSCHNSTLSDSYYNLFLLQNEDIDNNLIKPCFPLGLYAYIINNNAALKLTSNENFKQVSNNIDYCLATYIASNKNFNLYAFEPALANIKKKEKKIKEHDVIYPITSMMYYSNNDDSTLDDALSSNYLYFSLVNIYITYYTLLLFLLVAVSGLFIEETVSILIVICLVLLQLIELAYTKSDNKKLQTLLFELVLIILIYASSTKLRNNYKQN
jgi:GR25 family glycosyltransferase involved in LPS biosynthesis